MAYQAGNMKSTSINGVKMYTVAGENRSLATWLNPKKLRALRKNPGNEINYKYEALFIVIILSCC